MSRSEKAMQAVREALEADPDAGTQDLFERAKEADASIGELSLRQFNARYPLQVKRDRSDGGDGAGSGGRKKQAPEGSEADPQREAIRTGLLRFAHDVAGAEDKAETIDVLTSVDDYVDEVAEALDR